MANINQEVTKLLNSNFLDELGDNKNLYESLSESNLPLVEKLLIQAAAIFIQNARDNVQKPKNGRNLISSGDLQDSIFSSPIRVGSSSVEFDIGYKGKGAAYADFVNEGVRGIESSDRAPQSPYSFKAANGLTPGPSMRKALEQWIKKNRAKIRNTPVNVNYKKSRGGSIAGAAATQSKRRALSQGQNIKTFAYAIGTNIRKKGLRRSGFFNDAIRDTFNESFFDAVASVVGADLSVGIRRLNNLSTK